MTLITEQTELVDFCRELANAEFVTVDTEFMRESTYWPKLCLVQLAGPERHAAIDPLAPDLDLQPLYDLMADEAVLKEIGKASCRERVCEYVSISVVAGTLKKK